MLTLPTSLPIVLNSEGPKTTIIPASPLPLLVDAAQDLMGIVPLIGIPVMGILVRILLVQVRAGTKLVHVDGKPRLAVLRFPTLLLSEICKLTAPPTTAKIIATAMVAYVVMEIMLSNRKLSRPVLLLQNKLPRALNKLMVTAFYTLPI